MTKGNQNYGADQIQVLEGLEAVRKRPGMYIGSTSSQGLHHLVWEIIDNSIDEHLAGYCTDINLTIHKDNSITVTDNGRGIPVELNEKLGLPTLEVVLTVLHAGGKFGGEGSGYKVSGGLHGVGSSCVNALSDHMIATVKRDGKIHQMEFSQGKTIVPLHEVGTNDGSTTGTSIWFKPDPTIFKETTEFDYETIKVRVKQSAYLNPGLRISIVDERQLVDEENNVKTESFCFEGGVSDFVLDLNNSRIQESKSEINHIHPDVIHVREQKDGVNVEVALQYLDDYDKTRILSFANNIRTADGVTHEAGFKTALTTVLKNYILANQLAKPKELPSGEDNRPGLTAIISVKVTEPQFEGQTKGKLGNSEVRYIVDSIVTDVLTRFFNENPETANAIVDKILSSFRERMAARNARNLERKKKNTDSSLPWKLKDCTGKELEKRELFLVEGDSAGGSAIDGRDRVYQAILPLRGKVLNAAKASMKQIYSNQEIDTIRRAIGTGIGEDFDYSKLRYNRIVIMTDADVDGHHISLLLITLFYRFMRPLIENGHIYLANPPLYKIQQGKKIRYEYSDEGLQNALEEIAKSPKPNIQRYKGLGEMNAPQLWDTTMNPETRTLYQVTMEDIADAGILIEELMGDDVEPRRIFLEENSHRANIDA